MDWTRKVNPVSFLQCYSKQDFENDWQLLGAWSEFGDVLRNRAWLQTSKGYVKPTSAFLDTPEFRDFFGDSVPYVATNILPGLLQKFGVRVHMTTEILVGLLREMSTSENHDQVLLVKIYRRLQDSDFDTTVFRAEKLVFLAQPTHRWLTADKLVWEDAGQLFDADFGYLCLPGNYGNSELEHFFTQKLKIPIHPELRHYAEAWHKLCLKPAADKTIAERKIKVILTRLSDSQDELSICDWWQAIKPKLHIWTLAGGFQSPKHVYVPDHAVAVELFGNSGRIHVAFPQKPARTVFGFLRSMSCPSLAGAVQPRLCEVAHESQRAETSYLTPAAKELCVSLVCSHPGWQERQPLLQALLKTVEVGVSAITIEYFFPADSAAGTQQQSRDAYWDVSRQRLLLRDNVDLESLRDAAAKSIAAELFGEAASADLQSEFFRFLMASVKRARKLMSERSNWRLLPEQQQWLRDQDWKITVTELDEVEPPEPPRPPAAPLKTATLSTAINAATNTKASSPACDTTSDQDTSSTNASCADSGQEESDSTEADVSKNEQQPNVTPASIEPIALYDADSTTADFVEVRGYTRSRAQRSQEQQSREAQREEGSGLSAVTADDKTALEKCGRDFATQKLKAMDYSVTPMSQNNPGFDLKAEKPGDVIKVEVKGHAGEANSVFVTQREWEEYLRTRNVLGETWELWNVENLAKSSKRRPTIQRIRLIPKSAMKESGYWINLKQCSQESPPPSTSSEKHL